MYPHGNGGYYSQWPAAQYGTDRGEEFGQVPQQQWSHSPAGRVASQSGRGLPQYQQHHLGAGWPSVLEPGAHQNSHSAHLSAFERSFESFLNSKFKDQSQAPAAFPVVEPASSTTSSFSSVLAEFGQQDYPSNQEASLSYRPGTFHHFSPAVLPAINPVSQDTLGSGENLRKVRRTSRAFSSRPRQLKKQTAVDETSQAVNAILFDDVDQEEPNLESTILEESYTEIYQELNDEKKFKCEFCSKTFIRSHHLKEHRMIHTGDYPFTCELCAKGFKRESVFISHKCILKEDKEKVKQTFTCEECCKIYVTKQGLQGHKCLKEVSETTQSKTAFAKNYFADEQDEIFVGHIVERVYVEVPLVLKQSSIIFSETTGAATIKGDMIEFDAVYSDTDVETAAEEGWEVNVIGRNVIWTEEMDVGYNKTYMDRTDIEAVDEIAKVCSLEIEDVRDILMNSETIISKSDEKIENDSAEKNMNTTESLMAEDANKTMSNTLEEVNKTEDRISPQTGQTTPAGAERTFVQSLSVSKFAYFQSKIKISTDSGDDSEDEDWEMNEHKCKLCKRKFSTRWHLRKHSKVHSETKSAWKCKACQRKFYSKALLDGHRCGAAAAAQTSIVNYDSASALSSNDETLEENVVLVD